MYSAMRLWIAVWILLTIKHSDAAGDCDVSATGNSISTDDCKLEPVKKCRFDSKLGAKKCTTILERKKRQSSVVGLPCQVDHDCQTVDGGTYCDSTHRCACLPAFENINGYCWPKRNLGESCQFDEQCFTVSPNSHCGANGICQCDNNMLPVITHDGSACLLPGQCPTNGANSKLRHPTTGDIVECGGVNGGPKACMIPVEGQNGSEAAPFAYSCVCANPLLQAGSVDDLCAHENAGSSYCCPVRAIACIQPKDEGIVSGSSSERFWYNSVTDSCEPFTYHGGGGNANNYWTKTRCESYCKTSSLRGSPEMNQTTGQNGHLLPPTPVVCTETANCSQNYECQSRGGAPHSICCPSRDFVCGPQGGINDPDVVVPDVGDASFGVSNAVTRYYYDHTDGQCHEFTYRGYGGTFNNFQTQAECLAFCAPPSCPTGQPLQDLNGNLVHCGSGGAVCPRRYACAPTGICCTSQGP